MDEEHQRLSSRKAVVATLLLGAIVLAGVAIFVIVLSQRACSGSVTALSCLGIGIAFLIAVALLILAGVLLAWFLPVVIERWRTRHDRPPNAR